MPRLMRLISLNLVVVFWCLFLSCKKEEAKKDFQLPAINTAHLDHLYDERVVEGDTVGIIHIYAEAPEYKWRGDDDEGIACVDDAARALIFYLQQHSLSKDEEHLRKAVMLARFLMAMQSPNGYYYNFIWEDGTINKDGSTSKAEPGWWSWRALWALSELESIGVQDQLLSEIVKQRNQLIDTLMRDPQFRQTQLDTAMGIDIPTWLPKGSGTDQSSIILISLADLIKSEPTASPRKDSIMDFMHHLADGIMMMQIRQKDSLHDGAFLSWENLWHAYGNIQAYALQVAGAALQDTQMINAGIYEVDHFYRQFLNAGGMDHFWVRKDGNVISRYDSKQFPQIAYGRRPMIYACVEAYRNSGEQKYLDLAHELFSWFSGSNPANQLMYDPSTGRGYDGMQENKNINKNAGAESTIEALLSIQAIAQLARE